MAGMSERAQPPHTTGLPRVPLMKPIEPAPTRWTMPTNPPLDDSDIVALGADLEPGTLLAGYRSGLFPMPFDRRRIAWFSPDPRGIIPLDAVGVSRSLRRSMKRYEVRMNTCFTEVMAACADPGRDGGWINDDFIDAYTRLHELGWAHSIEMYDGDLLVGGLYGLRVGGLFAGESMFHRAPDASKVGLVHLTDWLIGTGATLLDVQWTTPHLVSLGAINLPRAQYLDRLDDAING